MTARERLKTFIIQNTYSHDTPFQLLPEGEGYGTGPRPDLDISDTEYPAVVDREIDAYRAEVLREAAERIRLWADKNQRHLLEGERTGARMVADMIDVFIP